MKKFILMALTGTAIALAAPEFAAATPLSLGGGLGSVADQISTTEQARHRRWHRRYHHRWHYRRHCWHRRHWSGRRCW